MRKYSKVMDNRNFAELGEKICPVNHIEFKKKKEKRKKL